jgi:DNA-directed RNA polymerase specialized sigma24 family protein
VGDQTTTASAHEVLAVEPVIRRVVAARAAHHADVDDLVQDCLERLLVARERLAPKEVLPYAVVTAIAIPGALAAWAAGKARAHPVQSAVSVAAGSAAAATTAVLGAQLARPGPSAPAHVQVSSAPAPSAPVAVISHLSVAGHAVSDAEAQRSLRPLIGRTATATGTTVVAAVTRNGFWIGSSRARIWVELVGPLRPLRIRPGDRSASPAPWSATRPPTRRGPE